MKWLPIIPASGRRMRERQRGVGGGGGIKETRDGGKSELERVSSTFIFCLYLPSFLCPGGSLNSIKRGWLIKLRWMTLQWHRIQPQSHPVPLYIFDIVIEETKWKWRRGCFPQWQLCARVKHPPQTNRCLLLFSSLKTPLDSWMPLREADHSERVWENR